MESLLLVPRSLSPREEQIVQLSVEGLTNDAIANRLGLSPGTVNTYWNRIRLKVGGAGRTDTVARILTAKAKASLDEVSRGNDIFESFTRQNREFLAMTAILKAFTEMNHATVWAVDQDCILYFVENGGSFPICPAGWQLGYSIFDTFKSIDPSGAAVNAHLSAIDGRGTTVELTFEATDMNLRTMPLLDENQQIIGCIGLLW